MSQRPKRHTGWFVVAQGLVFLVFGAAILGTATSGTWQTVGLVIGLMGGALLGTGGSILMLHEEDDGLPPVIPREKRPWINYDHPVCLKCGRVECDGCDGPRV